MMGHAQFTPTFLYIFFTFLIEELFRNLSSYFPKKNRKSRKNRKHFQSLDKRGQSIWKASHSNIWKQKLENMEIQKIAR